VNHPRNSFSLFNIVCCSVEFKETAQGTSKSSFSPEKAKRKTPSKITTENSTQKVYFQWKKKQTALNNQICC
jgi:hypothetical protein